MKKMDGSIESFADGTFRRIVSSLWRTTSPTARFLWGEKGALLVTPEAAWYSEPVSVDVKGVQGAGDSMVSGFAYVIAKQCTQGDQLLKMAVSCAHASLELPGTQMCTMAGVEKRFPLTPVKRLCTF